MENILKAEEKAVFTLRSLYRDYGYQPYKMSKFEEYDFYAKNKDFLVSDGIISFTDTNGKLMALKPDVTLSIIKNFKKDGDAVQRVYYNENVYRIANDTHQFKEIMQTGLECMGKLDSFLVEEVLILALKSLQSISKDFVLEISHMGFLQALLDEADKGADFNRQIAVCIGEKNIHELTRICGLYDVPETLQDKLKKFIGIYGERAKVLSQLESICDGNDAMEAALTELKNISAAFDDSVFASNVRFDFSLVNDMNYYDDIVFQGFIKGIPEVILSGGRYDRLMKRIGHDTGAIGFALYLDLLETIREGGKKYDVDAVLLYEEGVDSKQLRETLKELSSNNIRVSVQKSVPSGMSYRKLLKFNGKGVEIIEDND